MEAGRQSFSIILPIQLGPSAWKEATVWKRRYQGLNFTRHIRFLKGFNVHHERFLGIQYFFNFYYTLQPWNLDCKMIAGQFLAKDRGVRFEISRWFQSGLQVSLWYTITNGHDHVNGRRYYDKGFAFNLPIDFFLRQSKPNLYWICRLCLAERCRSHCREWKTSLPHPSIGEDEEINPPHDILKNKKGAYFMSQHHDTGKKKH